MLNSWSERKSRLRWFPYLYLLIHNFAIAMPCLRSFGHQGALYYVFLASDPLKTSREYAVFTLRTRGPKVCVHTRNLASNAKGKCTLLFWLHQMIALLHTSRGKDKISLCFMKNERFSKNGNIKNLVQKTKMGP